MSRRKKFRGRSEMEARREVSKEIGASFTYRGILRQVLAWADHVFLLCSESTGAPLLSHRSSTLNSGPTVPLVVELCVGLV